MSTNFQTRVQEAKEAFERDREAYQRAAEAIAGPLSNFTKMKANITEVMGRIAGHLSAAQVNEETFKRLFNEAGFTMSKEARKALTQKSEEEMIAGELENHAKSLQVDLVNCQCEASSAFDNYRGAYQRVIESRARFMVLQGLQLARTVLGMAIANLPSDHTLGTSGTTVALLGDFKDRMMKFIVAELEALGDEHKQDRNDLAEEFALPRFDRSLIESGSYLSPVMRQQAKKGLAVTA